MNNKILAFIIIDLFTVFISLVSSFLLRFDFHIPIESSGLEIRKLLYDWLVPFSFIQIIIFYFSGLYQRIWRFTSLFDLFSIFKAAIISSSFNIIGVVLLMENSGFPRSVLLLYFILNTLIVSLTRVSVRIYFSHFNKETSSRNRGLIKNIILIGAGRTGEKIAREIVNTPSTNFKISGFVDDDIEKIGKRLHGYKVIGNIKSIVSTEIIFDELLICTPTANGDEIREIVDLCKKTGKKYKIVPSLTELIEKNITLANIRDVSYSDLLGRKEVKLDRFIIEKMLYGKRILISGAGGSIGSELVNQCLSFSPSEIICLDNSEEKIFNIGLKKPNQSSKTIIKPVLISINNKLELKKVFNETRPQIIFHAAAYKHVPIQEEHPWTAVNTNIGGTLNIIELAHKFKVEKFVLVSTDKAVNPVNVMGATKRVAEKLIQSINEVSKTKYMAVRFGNVLGSSGSAIPIFQNQINKGGPVTITHPEMTRYFMSIHEASQLILQSASIGKDGEIFLLEMGKSIKIDRIARDLIRLSGYEPDTDIPIVYTGLRPGEKLYEELQHKEEKKVFTKHTKIMILKDGKSIYDWIEMKSLVEKLIYEARALDSDNIQSSLIDLVPTYQPRSMHALIKGEKDINRYEVLKAEA